MLSSESTTYSHETQLPKFIRLGMQIADFSVFLKKYLTNFLSWNMYFQSRGDRKVGKYL